MSLKIIIFVGIFVLVFVLVVSSYYLKTPDGDSYPSELLIGDKTISVEIADTVRERMLGLSGRVSLSSDTGMLFVFDEPGKYGIWMKDMNFPIDILWLDNLYTVVDIQKNVSPETFPEVFVPENPALYVLEMNAGAVDEYNVKIGDKFLPNL